MDFNEYQAQAKLTDQTRKGQDQMAALMVPLLGLAGETGSLLTHFKRYMRDGEGYEFFRQRLAEELGDIIWNVSNVATKMGLSLDDVALGNLLKIRDRWAESSADEAPGARLLDERYPDSERFPRQFVIETLSQQGPLGNPRMYLTYNGHPFGDDLSDNASEDDGYRFHDVFHLAFVAVLGWSPVLRGRGFFNCKRKSDPCVDEIQDGGRAAVIDEAIVALIFVEAKKNGYYASVNTVEYNVLRTIKDLTSHLEVSRLTGRSWEKAILAGFRVWREFRKHGKGRIVGDLATHTLRFEIG